MLNNVIIVGRLVKDPEILESENGSKRTHVTVAVPRQYKNADGVYETDFIKCTLWNGVAEHTAEYCKKGDIIGIKGKIQTSNFEKNGEKEFRMDVVAERVTFLSESKKEMTQEQEK